MNAQVVDKLPDSQFNGRHRLLPEGGHEVPAILLLTIDGKTNAIGNLKENVMNPANVMVRLGTRVGDFQPSCVGFRVFLRTNKPRLNGSGSINDYYHVISCRFDPQGGTMSCTKATAEKKKDLLNAPNVRKEDLVVDSYHDLYRMDFMTSDTNAFVLTRHNPILQTHDNHVKKIDKLISYTAYASQTSLFFFADNVLDKYLVKAVKQNCVGDVGPDWKSGLPEDAMTSWPSNIQTQMVTGSTDVLNVALAASREPLLNDGPGTLVTSRPEAKIFKDFVRKTYPNTREEPVNKIYPLLLNVPEEGYCVELPFGASMINRSNSYAAFNALHALLAMHIPASRIGLVALYPAQVEIYLDALGRCHKYNPKGGYDVVQCDILERWAHRTTGIAIVDLVRTSNASGNLGWLAQANRLKMLLSLHENGLIVVGSRSCTATAHGNVTSTKLDKVLQWFVDHGRVAQVSSKGVPILTNPPLNMAPRPSAPAKNLTSVDSGMSHSRNLSTSSAGTDQSGRRYVGIPGLEHLRAHRPSNDTSRYSMGSSTGDKGWQPEFKSPTKKGLYIGGIPPPTHATAIGKAVPHAAAADSEIVKPESHTDIYISQARREPPGVGGSFPGRENQTVIKHSEPRTTTSNVTTNEPHIAIPSSAKENNKPTDSPNTPRHQKIPPLPMKLVPPPVGVAPFKNLTNRVDKESLDNSSRLFAKGSSSAKQPTKSVLTTSATSLSSSSTEFPSQPSVRLPPSETMADAFSQDPRFAKGKVQALGAPEIKIEDLSTTNLPPLMAPPRIAAKSPAQGLSETPLPSPGPGVTPLPSPVLQIPTAKKESAAKIYQTATNIMFADCPLPHQNPTQKSANTRATPETPADIAILSKPEVATTASSDSNAEEDVTFKGRYQPKYRAIRSRFTNLSPNIKHIQPQEDQLFRRLLDAVFDENEDEFDRAYTELLGMLARLQTSELRRT